MNDTMPAVVIMDENYDKLLEQCQTQELEVVISKYFIKRVELEALNVSIRKENIFGLCVLT